jgi:hypothetical protein
VVSPKENIQSYGTSLSDEIRLILSTLQFKTTFAEAVNAIKMIKNVSTEASWFGLGAVRCTPSYIKEDAISSDVERDVNDLNDMIVNRLSEQDPNLFKKGMVPGTTRTCILIGVVSLGSIKSTQTTT